MIRLNTPKGDLQLKDSTRIEWVRVNPLFAEDVKIEVDRSYNFSIPKTPANERILGDAKLASKATLYVDGRLFMSANLHILRISDDDYDVSLSSDIYKLNLDEKITQLNWPNTPVSLGSIAKGDANTGGLSKFNFVFPLIYNLDATAVKAINGEKYLGQEGLFINQELIDSTNVRVDVLSPQYGLRYILNEVVSQISTLHIAGDWLETIDDMIIYNNTVINLDAINFIFEIRKNGAGLDFVIPSRETFDIAVGDVVSAKIYGMNSSGNSTHNDVEYTVHSSDIDADGKVHVVNFLTAFATKIYTPTGGLYALVATSGFYFDFDAENPYFYFSPSNMIPNDIRVKYANISKSGAALYADIKATNHLPNISSGAFIKGLKDFFCLSIVPNYAKDELVFISRKHMLQTSKYVDYTHKLLDSNTADLDPAIDYRFVYKNDSDDILANDPFYRNHANNNAEHVALGYEEKNIECATTNSVNIRPHTAEYPVPKVQKPIRYTIRDFDNLTLLLLKYRGFTESSTKFGEIYTADTDGLNPNQAYNSYLKEWYSLFKNGIKKYNYSIRLTYDDILGLDPEKKWKVRHHMYLWKEIKTPISVRYGLEPSTVQLVKVEYGAECNLGSEEIIDSIEEAEGGE
jgi:hypothetical protein